MDLGQVADGFNSLVDTFVFSPRISAQCLILLVYGGKLRGSVATLAGEWLYFVFT